MGADQSSEAVVLRRSDSGETDRRLTLLTLKFGKIDVIAKGARKAASRLGGSSEPLIRAHFTWAEGRARRFVTQVQPITSYPRIRNDYDFLIAGLTLAEILAVSVPFESPQFDVEGSYNLFVHCLGALNTAEKWLPACVWAHSKLMAAEGVSPEWLTCASCGEPVNENPAWISPSSGGYVSSAYALSQADRFQVSMEVLIALSRIVDLDEPPENVKYGSDCLRVLFQFWRHHLEARLPAFEALLQGLPVETG